MLSGIKRFVNDNSDDIILVAVVVLISLISFAAGYIVSKQQDREPLRFEQTSSVDEVKTSSSPSFL